MKYVQGAAYPSSRKARHSASREVLLYTLNNSRGQNGTLFKKCLISQRDNVADCADKVFSYLSECMELQRMAGDKTNSCSRGTVAEMEIGFHMP